MKTLLKIITLLLTSNLVLGQQGAFTLREAINYAVENHVKMKMAMLEEADAKQNVRQFTAIGMPKIFGSSELQHFLNIPTSILPAGSFFEGDPANGIPPNPAEDLAVQFGVKNIFNAGLSADVLLFDGSFFVGLQAARLFRDMVSGQTDITRDEIAANVSKAYVGVILAKRNADLLNSNIRNLEETLAETRTIYEEGFIEKLDVDRLNLSLNNLSLEKEKVQGLIDLSKNALKFSMGMDVDEDIEVSETLEDLEIGHLDLASSVGSVQLDFNNRSEYIALQTAASLRAMDIKQIKFQRLPVIKGFGSYQQVLQGNSLRGGRWFPTTVVGLNLSLPIFDGFDKSSRLERAEIASRQHQLTIEDTERAMTLEVANAKVAYANAQKTVVSAEQSEQLAQDIYDTALIKYREGVGSSLEIKQSEADLFAAQARMISALYDLMSAEVDLQKALGTLY